MGVAPGATPGASIHPKYPGANRVKLSKRRRTALRKVITKSLFGKTKYLVEIPNDLLTEENKDETFAMIKTLKESELKSLDNKMVDLLNEYDEFEEEMEASTNFEIIIGKNVKKLQDFINKMRKTDTREVVFTAAGNKEGQVRLPILNIEKFDGCPLKWQTFIDTFEASIHSREDISDIQKLQYLCGYLINSAKKCAEGFPLPNANYIKALELLKERYGNPQLVISAHMTKIMEMKKLNESNVEDLRNLLDTTESHVRSLENHGVNKEHFGALLIPIVQEKVPSGIRLQ